MKIRDVIRLIESEGWRLERTRGSHRQYTHPRNSGLVTIAGHPAEDVHPKTLATIWRQAGLRKV